jgi:hypothetical protein
MGALNGLTTKLSVSARGRVATVTNRGGAVAAMVRLAVRDTHGERILPVRYDDNYFWLLPGETRTVALSWRANGGARIEASAYNAGAVTTAI